MTLWLCATCGIEHADTPEPPVVCEICTDERQYLPEGGQRWTTVDELRKDRTWELKAIDDNLYEVSVFPSVGIGHRGFLLTTPTGNVLWEPPGYYDDALLGAIRDLGSVVAIVSSHPHLSGVCVSLSHELGDVPVYWASDDRRWIRRPDPVITLWQDRREIVPGITLHQCGGHFAGSAVLHYEAGASGKGILLTGDTMLVGSDRATVTFLRSYPNRIPLPERSVRRIADTVAPLSFDRLYSGFAPAEIQEKANEAVQFSARRYISWIRDEIRDPDDRF
jgi:hypothetical protein